MLLARAPTISIANNHGHRAMLRKCGKPEITMSAFYYNISLESYIFSKNINQLP